MNDVENRLKNEREFQNQRSSGMLEKHRQRRSKHNYLAERASIHYRNLLEEYVKGKEVVVVGPAVGGVTPLARMGAKKVIGVDISDVAVRILNERINEEGLQGVASAIVGNAEDLDMPDESCDLICCTGVLHHLDVEAALKSWAKVLKPSGKVLMMEPLAYNPGIYLYRVLTPAMRTVDEHPLKPQDFKLMRNNFKTVQSKGYVLTSTLSLLFSYIPGLLYLREKTNNFFSKVDDKLVQFFPSLLYLCWTSVITLEGPKKEN